MYEPEIEKTVRILVLNEPLSSKKPFAQKCGNNIEKKTKAWVLLGVILGLRETLRTEELLILGPSGNPSHRRVVLRETLRTEELLMMYFGHLYCAKMQ